MRVGETRVRGDGADVMVPSILWRHGDQSVSVSLWTYESFNQQVFFNEKCVVGYHQPIHAHHHLRSTRLIIYGSRVKVKESLLNKCQLHIFPNFYSSLFFKYHNKYRHTMKILKSLHPQLMVSVSECRE